MIGLIFTYIVAMLLGATCMVLYIMYRMDK